MTETNMHTQSSNKYVNFFLCAHVHMHCLGALLAFLILKDVFGPLAYGFIFGCVGGMMVIVALKDLLPTARKFDKHGHVVTCFFILGMFVMAASLVFFEY